MDITIVIPNYNGQELLQNNLPKVFETISAYKDGDKEIIVSDDASFDGSIKVLENLKLKMDSKYPDIKFKIVKNEKNLGFSSNVNKGVKEAKGEIIILLNTDVIPEKGFLNHLLKHFEDPKVFAVGCMDKSIEEDKVVLRGRGLGVWKRGFLVHSRGEVNKTDTLWVSCGSGIFRKSIWDKLGGLDTLYNPFYWEDIDLSYRALKSGYKILFEPKSIVLHEHEKGSVKKKYSDSEVKTIAYRNQFIFVWKNATDLNLQLVHILWLPYHFIKSLLNRDWNFFIGFFGAFRLLPKTIESSFKVQKLFVKRDKEILDEFINEN